MKLYIANRTCSLAAQIIGHEIGQPLEIIHVNVRDKTYGDGKDYLAVNRHGYVPTLVLDDGASLSETLAVTTYLADTRPEAKLIPPAGTFERVKLLELQTFIATEVHQKFIPVFRDYVTEDAKDQFRAILIEELRVAGRAARRRSHLLGRRGLRGRGRSPVLVTPWTERTHVRVGHLKNLWA